MCATNYLGISLIKAFEPAAQVSALPSKCQGVLFPSDRRSLSETDDFKLDVQWPDANENGTGLVSKLFPNFQNKIFEYIDSMTQNVTEISGYIHEATQEIIENMQGGNGMKAKCNKEPSQDQENIFLDEDDEEEADRRDLEEDDTLSVAVKEKMDELKESMEQKIEEMIERLEEKIENKFEAADEKYGMLEKKMERKFDEIKSMIARLLEQTTE